MGGIAAFTFVARMINFPVAGGILQVIKKFLFSTGLKNLEWNLKNREYSRFFRFLPFAVVLLLYRFVPRAVLNPSYRSGRKQQPAYRWVV